MRAGEVGTVVHPKSRDDWTRAGSVRPTWAHGPRNTGPHGERAPLGAIVVDNAPAREESVRVAKVVETILLGVSVAKRGAGVEIDFEHVRDIEGADDAEHHHADKEPDDGYRYR